MLSINNIEVVYLNSILVLRGVTLEVPDGKIRALLGANGAGKTTTLKAVSGLLRTEEGKVTDGSIVFDDKQVHNLSVEETVRMGITQAMEGRLSFEHLSVEENLRVGACTTKDRQQIKKDLDMVYGYFPRLKSMRNRITGYLSGGEQQMLVVGRCMMSHPKIMLLDEPSLGLAPFLIEQIFNIVKELHRKEHYSFLLVEQNALAALDVAEYAYVMENGRIVLDGPSEKLSENEDIREFYFGLSEFGEKKSYRDVKHYKRRKRWLA
ncbi:MAG: ABC transporter ATP-binding protein [Deltaproteobacteria bacterium]|nr:MAG: ABC transporter ATP-binding protein [Deltaproteobacteria bacterium]